MIDQIAKGIFALGVAAAAWYTDKYVKQKTGKHIHEHAVDFATKLWRRMKNWASRYLSEHPRIRKVYLSAVSIAAEIKKAKNRSRDFVQIKIFGKEASSTKHIFTEDIPLAEAQTVLRRAKTEAVLAQR